MHSQRWKSTPRATITQRMLPRVARSISGDTDGDGAPGFLASIPSRRKTKETWLGCKSGFGICSICYARKGAKSIGRFGKGVGGLRRNLGIALHAECAEHQSALQAWQQRLRAEASGIAIVSKCTVAPATAASATAASATAAAASIRTPPPTQGYRAVVAARALLETSGSFRSFDVLRDALVGEERQALESHWHCKRLVSTMAHYEKELTHRLLREGAVFRLQADGLERAYQVEIGTVLWSLPSFLKHLTAHGEQMGWLEVLGHHRVAE